MNTEYRPRNYCPLAILSLIARPNLLSLQERLAEEQKRKADLVAVINRHREDKMASLEARKQSALLNQQEEELSQMVRQNLRCVVPVPSSPMCVQPFRE